MGMYTEVDSAYGFLCGPKENPSTVLPDKYLGFVTDWSAQLYEILSKDKVIPDGFYKNKLKASRGGCEFLYSAMHSVHPNLIEMPSAICYTQPRQGPSETFDSYVRKFLYHQAMYQRQ